MDDASLQALFDRQAPNYDQQWSRLAAFREGIHVLLAAIFHDLPDDARVLCVGAGTGAEILSLAQRFPGWTFTAVEPSPGMLGECRRRLTEQGCAQRCTFHEGYLESLPPSPPFDAATCLLVSQFILDARARARFFGQIAARLAPRAILASSDLAFDTASASYGGMLETWMRTLSAADLPPDRMQEMRQAYERDVAVLPPGAVEAIIMAGGFDDPVRFFQAGLIHAWYARRSQTGPAFQDDRGRSGTL